VNSRFGAQAALARPALIVLALGFLLALSTGGDRGVRSLAQETAATPATPVADLPDFAQLVTERPGEFRSGSCAEPGETIATLTPLTTPEGEAQGQGTAIEAERSYTSVPIPIESFLESQANVTIFLSAEDDTVIACGDIGGVLGESGSVVVRLSEQQGSGFVGIAYLAAADPGTTGASIFLVGERTVAETRELVAATPAADAALEPIPEPTPTAEPVQVVDLALLEWLIDAPDEIRAGQVNFAVTNEGAEAHSLVIESGGVIIAELEQPIAPGESGVLSATLLPGEYVLYCPIGDGAHRAEGMERTLLVVP
jgi:hypothetical protein